MIRHRMLGIFVMMLCAVVTTGAITTSSAQASTSDGTIDGTNRYAWSENAGWIDFGTSGGAVHVTDGALSGYAYAENLGWISLNCSNTSSCGTVSYKVLNNDEGTLSGYAWGENVGWIHFAPSSGGVTIDSSGNFAGYAYGENIGWIVFNCSTTSSCGTVSYKTATDWRPLSTRSGGGGGGSTPTPSGGATGVGGYSILDIKAQPQTPPKTLPNLLPPNITTTTPNVNPFTSWPRFLSLYDTGEDARRLQQFLNRQGYIISKTGAGSPGNETKKFGILTYKALVKWQKDHKLPATGYFGPLTLALMKALGL